MHFISTGRNERIRRWISEQTSRLQGDDDSDRTPKNQDEEENSLRREHDARGDMSWDIEELEREMALTAYAFGKDNWRISVDSVDLSKLDLPTLKRLSELTVYSKVGSMIEQEAEELPSTTSSPRDNRRDARIVSDPPQIPPTPNEFFELPQPQIQRSAPVPPPITINSARSSGVQPITFILQESASPQPDTVHFTPGIPDMEAFPSTPRSFNSYLQRNSQDKSNIQELFFSPRLQQDSKQPSTASSQPEQYSPGTPYSYSEASDVSTPSLSAFPSTPASSYPSRERIAPWKANESIPPVPDLPPLHLDGSGPLPAQANRDKELPAAPDPESTLPIGNRSTELLSLQNQPGSGDISLPNGPEQEQEDSLSDAGTDVSIGQMSSKYSVFSSRFSLSSLGSNPEERRDKWPQFNLGRSDSRSRAGSIGVSGTNDQKGVRTRMRSNSAATAVAASASHSRNNSTFGVMANSRIGQNSRAASSLGMHSRAQSSLGIHSRTGSKTGATSLSRAGTPSLSRSGSLNRKGSAPSVPFSPIKESMTTPDGETSFLSMQDEERPQVKNAKTKMRDIMSRMSLKKSKSAGTLPVRPRPPRPTPPVPLSTGGIVKAVSHDYIGSSASTPSLAPSLSSNAPSKLIFPLREPPGRNGVARGVQLPPLSMPSFPPVSVPLPPTPLVGPMKNLFASREILTPKTPTSGMSSSSFWGGGSHITRENADFLLFKGIDRDRKHEETIRKWCEKWGVVKQVVRLKDSGDIVIQFKNKDVVKQIYPQEVSIPEIGLVSLCWTR
ncbi:hypothetical protein M422DRAFT_48220 [Sphaerobolus stellatus SS14]|uniref:Uncharacterized protein n=1 Tax=Sphaerobolus stellatus (strain SS14) TaxID=990650 RepID=A0A0C9UVU6_SPHS4|nr:hypothetical protein M422DRAFT_54147 [Sphaerobolus stellatus SS14]KIJ42355.1 hypothetical protein M422DRAFT_48220 [Sphaerobolus stellatus SS14]